MWWRTWPLASQGGPKIHSCNCGIHAQQPPLFKVTLVGGHISHRGAATQLGPELWSGRCAEWQEGKEITDTGEQASLGNEMLSGTQMALATGSLATPMIQDYDTWLSGNRLHLSQDKRDTHIWFNNWRSRCCQGVEGAQERQEYFIIIIWPCCMACGILVSWSGMETAPPALKAQNLNHWTTREVLWISCTVTCAINWNVSHLPPSSYIEALTSKVTVFGDSTVKEVIKVRWGHKVGPLIWLDWRPYGKRKRQQRSSSRHAQRKRHVRTWWAGSHLWTRRRSHLRPTLLASGSWTCPPETCERTDVYCLNHPVCAVCCGHQSWQRPRGRHERYY